MKIWSIVIVGTALCSSLSFQEYYLAGQGLTFQVATTPALDPIETVDYAVGLTSTSTPGCPLSWSTGKASDASSVTLFSTEKRIKIPPSIQATAGSYTAQLYAILSNFQPGALSCFGLFYFPLNAYPFQIYPANVPIAGGGGYSLYFNRSNLYPEESTDQSVFAKSTSASITFPWYFLII